MFTSFILSQFGMVRHRNRLLKTERDRQQRRRFVRARIINTVGGCFTGLVLVIVLATTFTHGAHLVVIAVPLLWLMMRGIHRHYDAVRHERREPKISLSRAAAPPAGSNDLTARAQSTANPLTPVVTKAPGSPAGRPMPGSPLSAEHASVCFSPASSDLPPGYPRDYDRRIRLADGRIVTVRPLTPADGPQLTTAILTADPDTLRRRFLGGAPHVTPGLIARLTSLDYVRRFALIAAEEGTGRGVAIARYEATDSDVAEVSVVVDPPWRRVGVATALIELLAQAAIDRGIREFTASYLAENRPVAALVAWAGTGQRVIHQGIAEVVMALDREQVRAALRALESSSR